MCIFTLYIIIYYFTFILLYKVNLVAVVVVVVVVLVVVVGLWKTKAFKLEKAAVFNIFLENSAQEYPILFATHTW